MNKLISAESPDDPAWSNDELSTGRLTRRTLIGRIVPAVAVALVGGAALGGAKGVEAGITWCKTDPVITVTYPQGTTATGQLLPNDNGFGLGYNLNL